MEMYDEEWAENYKRLATITIAGREGLYRLCTAYFRNLPNTADILVIGCGTGEELITLAKALPQASFVAIDPAEAMLTLCRKRLEKEDLSERIKLDNCTLDDFSSPQLFDAATAILVSQHLDPDAKAQEFFQQLAALLKPGGLLYSADIHIGNGQDQESLMELWHNNLIMSGIEAEMADDMLSNIKTKISPRREEVITGFIQNAGFDNILMPFRSVLYGAWAAKKSA